MDTTKWKFCLVLLGAVLGLYAPIELGRLIYIYATEWGVRPFFVYEYIMLISGACVNFWMLWHLGQILWRTKPDEG